MPFSIQAEPILGMIDKLLVLEIKKSLSTKPVHEHLRAYHARLDLMQAMINPDQADIEWQINQTIDDSGQYEAP